MHDQIGSPYALLDALQVPTCTLTEQDLDALPSQPCASLNLSPYLKPSPGPSAAPSQTLPFSMSSLPLTQTVVGRSMLERLASDMRVYALQASESTRRANTIVEAAKAGSF